jgi:hypothetical protein
MKLRNGALGLVILACVLANILYPGIYRFDQDVIHYSIARDGYPSFNFGVGIYWIVELVNSIFRPEDAHFRNQVFKAVASVAFLLPVGLLGRDLIRGTRAYFFYLLLLVLSLFPFLWLSTELFLAGALAWTFWLIQRRADGAWVGFALFLTSTLKVEVILPALLIAILYWRDLGASKDRKRFVGSFVGCLGIAHGAGMVLMGSDYWTRYSVRSLWAIVQHYSDLFYKHQVGTGIPIPFDEADQWGAKLFPEAKSALGFVIHYPSHYLDYVAMSTMRGLKKVGLIFGPGILLILYRIWVGLRGRDPLTGIQKYFVWSMIGIIPMILLSFPHVRYLSRYFGPMLLILLMWLESLSPERSRERNLGWLILGGMGVFQAALFVRAWRGFDSQGFFWFPD